MRRLVVPDLMVIRQVTTATKEVNLAGPCRGAGLLPYCLYWEA